MDKTPQDSTLLIHYDYGLSKSVGFSFVIDCWNGFSTSNIQGVIIMTTQLLALGLKRIRQPKVIAEVIGGILLGTPFKQICLYRNDLL